MRKSIIFFGDLALFYCALLLTLVIRYGDRYNDFFSVHFTSFSIIFAIWILVFYVNNFYELSFVKNNLQFFSTLFTIMGINIAIAIAFFYLIPFFGIAPKTNLFIFIAISLVLIVGWRSLYNYLLIKSGYGNNTLIIGLSDQTQELYDFLLNNPQLGYNALGVIDIKDQTAQSLLEKIITQKNVKTLVLGRDVYEIPQIIDVLYRLVGHKIRFYDVSKFSERVTGKIPLYAIDQSWFLSNLSEGEKRYYEIGKRFFDIVFSATILLITSPFWPLIAVAIKWDSEGSIWYTQVRTGRSGKLFKVHKFRSLKKDSESRGPVWATENDARSTRIGKFLRKTRIDELPQLWDILRGDMSFVGPRPERPEFHEKLKSEIPFYEERYLVSPGLTGWAQIKYKLDFSGQMTIADTLEKVQYDLFYIKNRSFMLDISITLKTIAILLKKVFK